MRFWYLLGCLESKGPQQELPRDLLEYWAKKRKNYRRKWFVLELVPLRRKNIKPHPQSSILVPLMGSFQNSPQASWSFFSEVPPPPPPKDSSLIQLGGERDWESMVPSEKNTLNPKVVLQRGCQLNRPLHGVLDLNGYQNVLFSWSLQGVWSISCAVQWLVYWLRMPALINALNQTSKKIHP